ncbi:MAG: hypothetical protein AB9844_11635 [Clostridiaceae bacterium]
MSKRRIVIDPDGKEMLAEENLKDYIATEPVPVEKEIDYISEEVEVKDKE